MTSKPQMQNPDMSLNNPLDIKLEGAIEGKRQLRNIDRSMKSITRLLKSNFQRNKKVETNSDKPPDRTIEPGGQSAGTIGTPASSHNKKKKPPKIYKPTKPRNRKPKVLILMNNHNSSEFNLNQQETKMPLNIIAPNNKPNKPPDLALKQSTSDKKQIKGVQSQHKNKSTISTKTDGTANSKAHIRLQKISRPKEVEDKEFYPNKLKRKQHTHDNWLKPRTELKMVCRLQGVVKRKMYTPRQGALQTLITKNVKPDYSELNMKGLVRVLDDKGLNDEDFMEILTCPSPVWWEDGKDSSDEFDEDPIPQEILEESDAIMTILQKEEIDKNEPIDALKDIKISKNDDIFLKKRSTLESLLGSIIKSAQTSAQSDSTTKLIEDDEMKIINSKNNLTKFSEVETKSKNDFTETITSHNSGVVEKEFKNKQESKMIDECDQDTDNHLGSNNKLGCDTLNNIEKNTDTSESVISETGLGSGAIEVDSVNTEEDVKMDIDYMPAPENIIESELQEESNTIPEKAISISTDDESLTESLYDDEILKDLEDMDIPIQKNDETSINDSPPENIEIPSKKHEDKSLTYMSTENVTKFDNSEDIKNETVNKKNNDISLLLPVGLPTLQIRPSGHKNKSLLKTSQEISNITGLGSHFKNINSKPDIEVKYLTQFSAEKYAINEKSLLIKNNSSLDVPIDTFYKKVRGLKFILREDSKGNKVTNQENKPVPCRSCDSDSTKSLNVTNDEIEKVKYCYECSSIFDTDKCNYCSNSLKNGNTVPQCCSNNDSSSS